MRRKRARAARSREIAKAAVLQELLLVSGIWFTVPFGETITIGRKRFRTYSRPHPPTGRPMTGPSGLIQYPEPQ
jgi:hypothetical protein